MKLYEVRVTIPEQRVEVWAESLEDAEHKAFVMIREAGFDERTALIVTAPLKAGTR